MIGTVGERDHSSWDLEEGAEIAPGRSVLKHLGGGNRYEVMLVWDDRLFAITVAKVLRPDYAQDERALKELREEAEALDQLAHPVLVRGFDAVLDGPGTNTNSNTDTNGDRTNGENTNKDNTTGNTGAGRDQATGRETRGENTDRPGLNTGVSTRGETDGRDGTGQTERR